MRPWAPWILCLLLLASAGGLVWWLNGRADRLSHELEETRSELALVRIQLAAARQDVGFKKSKIEALRRSVQRLERDLAARLRGPDLITQSVEKALEEREAARERRRKAAEEAHKPMPEGVRSALVTLNDLLKEDGYEGVRFSHARAIEDKVLQAVHVQERDTRQLITRFYLAERMSAELDRETSKLRLRFFEGVRIVNGQRTALPEAGELIELAQVNGPLWEYRLPFLLRVTGEYPKPEAAKPKVPAMSVTTRQSWLRRLRTLIELSKATETFYRVSRMRDIADGCFEDVLLNGYDRARRLSMSIEAGRMQVVIDSRRETVELVCWDGVQRVKGGVTKLSELGYRLLLPGVSPDQASQAMLGMVHRAPH